MQPLLHLLRSYLLILPSVSIRADCCHFRPVCPCISFLFPPSLSSTQFPLSFSIHLQQTGATTLTLAGAGAAVLSLGVYTIKTFCSPAINKRDCGQYCWMSGRLKNSPHLIYCTQGTRTAPPCDFIFIRREIVFCHVSMWGEKRSSNKCVFMWVLLYQIKMNE